MELVPGAELIPQCSTLRNRMTAHILVHLAFKNKVYMYILFKASGVYGTLYFRFPLETLATCSSDGYV